MAGSAVWLMVAMEETHPRINPAVDSNVLEEVKRQI
jgi:hypothetical protein